MEKIKKRTTFNKTMPMLMELSAIPETRVRATIPKTSSITAAARIVLPLCVFIAPISLSVSTVMPTDVAVKMTPINKFSNQASGPTLYMLPTRKPIASGTRTPNRAIHNAFNPAFFRSVMLVSSPASNISTMTPISDSDEIRSLGCTIFKSAGPKIIPANKEPTTEGICSRRVKSPKALVAKRIKAISNK